MIIEPVNERSVMIYIAQSSSNEIANRVGSLYQCLKADKSGLIVDLIPSYSSILVCCDLRKTGLRAFVHYLRTVVHNIKLQQSLAQNAKRLILPVYYGEEVAWDHQAISAHTRLSFAEVSALHSAQIYRVFAMGFAPGFAFLGHVNPLIAMPRKACPRKRVPQGSVAIADQQTAVYPSQSPGGWQIIGRTPNTLFDPQAPNLSEFEMGAEVQFEAIDRDTFLAMGGTLDNMEQQ